MSLTIEERKVRKLLILIAKGKSIARRKWRISYKEIWTVIRPNKKWGQAHTLDVVEWIARVSAFELQNNRPPLNEIVTPINKLVPKELWAEVKRYLKKLSGISAPYKSHEEAQESCWRYWANHIEKNGVDIEVLMTEAEVEEGYNEDRKVQFIKRNRYIIDDAKKRDKFKCQACGFLLKVNGNAIIDCHHKVPLSYSVGLRKTKLSDLVCLCPTCHRIAHTKPYPLSVSEIRSCRLEDLKC